MDRRPNGEVFLRQDIGGGLAVAGREADPLQFKGGGAVVVVNRDVALAPLQRVERFRTRLSKAPSNPESFGIGRHQAPLRGG